VLIALCFINLCYVFLQINKPFLPLPSGAFSFTTGVLITVSSAILVRHIFIHFLQQYMFPYIVDETYCFILLFQGFLTCYKIGSWPLFWGLLSFFGIWSGYSIKVSSFQFHIYIFFP